MDFIKQIKHLLWNWYSWECILMKIIKGKFIFIMLFLTLCWLQNMADICLGCFGLWELYSDYCMVSFFGTAFFKSDTLVALRRSLPKVPCITLVFSSTFMMSSSVNWCGSLQNQRMFSELLNITRQCILRFFDRNMNFIEQNIHVLYNIKSYECHLMKIIKG